jgi:hypothetical protein
MCAVHAKHVTITSNDMELVDGLRIMDGQKSYNEKTYAAYTANMRDSINPNQGNKQYHLLEGICLFS